MRKRKPAYRRACSARKSRKSPCGHQGDEVAARGHMRKICKGDAIIADLAGELAHFLMRPL